MAQIKSTPCVQSFISEGQREQTVRVNLNGLLAITTALKIRLKGRNVSAKKWHPVASCPFVLGYNQDTLSKSKADRGAFLVDLTVMAQ